MIIDYFAGKILIFVFMLICAMQDLQSKSVDLRVFLAMLIVEIGAYIGIYIYGDPVSLGSALSGAAPGVVLYLWSRFTRGSVGEGDAFFFALTGFAVGFAKNVLFLAAALLLAGVIGLFCIGKNVVCGVPVKNKAIAFLPVAASVGLLLLWKG